MRHRLDRKAVTILEIAREAGVSAATVSRFFNHPVKVKKETCDSVMAAIDRNHYVADGLAGSLSSRRSRLLGLIIPTITNSIYASSTQAVQQAAQNSGYTILVGISEFSEELEAKLIHQLLARRVEGLILTGQHRSAAVYEKIKRNHCPFVIAWKLSNQADLPSVSFNNASSRNRVGDYQSISISCLLLLLTLWACGQRACVVHHVHGVAARLH